MQHRQTEELLGSLLSLKNILTAASSNKDFERKIMYPRFNRELAIHFGFPYDLSFTELVKYEKIGLQERLDHAAKIGDTRIAKKLLELGARGHYHAMYSAVREGHKEIIELLLPSYNNNNYNAVMTMATELGREDIIKWVLEIKANDSRKQRETWNRRRMSR